MPNPLTRFDLNLLVALDALLSERHVTRAADRLYVSQPAMSGMLQRLRDQFDDLLLVKVGREMEITPKGAALQARVREALVGLRDLLESDVSFDPATARRHFRVAMSDYCGEVFLPSLARIFSERAPSLQIWTENIGSDTLERLAAGDIDLCIATDDTRLMGRGHSGYSMKTQVLFDDEYVCVVWNDYIPSRNTLSLEIFQSSHHAQTKFHSHTMTIEEDAFREAGIHLETRVQIPSFSSLFRLLPGTDMVATVQKRMADLFVPTLPLRMLAPPICIPPLHEAMIWHPRSELDPGHAWLRDRCVEVGTALGGAGSVAHDGSHRES